MSTRDNTFSVTALPNNVWAIRDNKTTEDVVCYLICGNTSALLFDTGIGLGDIKTVVESLTTLPVTAVVSHWHYDHIGGAHDFAEVWAWPSAEMKTAAAKGVPPDTIMQYTDAASLDGVGAGHWQVAAFPQAQFLQASQAFDLGGLELRVLYTPGHTADSVCLYQPEHGWLFTGDTAYNGPLYLQLPESSLADFAESIKQLAKLPVKTIFPGHNGTSAPVELLAETSALLGTPSYSSVQFPRLKIITDA